MRKQVGTHIGFDACACDMSYAAHEKVSCAVGGAHCEIYECDPENKCACQSVDVVDPHICQEADDQRKNDLTDAGDRCAGEVKHDKSRIFPVIRQKSPQITFFIRHISRSFLRKI